MVTPSNPSSPSTPVNSSPSTSVNSSPSMSVNNPSVTSVNNSPSASTHSSPHSQLIQPGSLSEQTIQKALRSSFNSHILVGLRACSSVQQVPAEAMRRILCGGSISEEFFKLCLNDRDELLKFIYPPKMGGHARLFSNNESLSSYYRIRAAQIYRTKWPCDPAATNTMLASTDDNDFLVGCALAYAQTTPDIHLLLDRLQSSSLAVAMTTMSVLLSREDLASEHPNITQQLFTKRFNFDWMILHQPTLDLCRKYQHPSDEIVRKWLDEQQWHLRMAAMASCCNCPEIAMELLERGACDHNDMVREEAARALAGRSDVPIQLIERLLNDQSRNVRLAMLENCLSNPSIPGEALQQWRQSCDPILQAAALHASAQRPETPFRQFVTGLESSSIIVQMAALKALLARRQVAPDEKEALPAQVLMCRLRADDETRGKIVRNLAQEVCWAYNVQLPAIQDDPLLPARIVYKMCMSNVIVIARIPSDAHVLCVEPGLFRTNKAEIVGIDTCFYDDRVGISAYDHSTIYRIGDMVEIPNFDMRSGVCGAGFYFVRSLQELC